MDCVPVWMSINCAPEMIKNGKFLCFLKSYSPFYIKISWRHVLLGEERKIKHKTFQKAWCLEMLVAPSAGLMFPSFLHLEMEFIELLTGPYLLCLNSDHETKLYAHPTGHTGYLSLLSQRLFPANALGGWALLGNCCHAREALFKWRSATSLMSSKETMR